MVVLFVLSISLTLSVMAVTLVNRQSLVAVQEETGRLTASEHYISSNVTAMVEYVDRQMGAIITLTQTVHPVVERMGRKLDAIKRQLQQLLTRLRNMN